MTNVLSPLAGTLVAIECDAGCPVVVGQTLGYIESMKMEHAVTANAAGVCGEWLCAVGEVVQASQLLLKIEQKTEQTRRHLGKNTINLPGKAASDPAFVAWQARQALTADAARPEAMAKRHAQGGRSARENVADLCTNFVEYGALAFAAQTLRRPIDELRAQTPADGMVTGLGHVNAGHFAPGANTAGVNTQAAVLAYDATVLAGTQGMRNHQKTDRLLTLAAERRLPVVLFAGGGGGRPGDVDIPIVAGLHVGTFAAMAKLHGKVPVLAVVHGRCFAGNAALAAMADVCIATSSANIGLGGPAMVEGGGLGRFKPEEIGPAQQQFAIGGLDLLARDEAHATALAKLVLSYFQGDLLHWQAPTLEAQQALRQLVPQQRQRAFAAIDALHGIADAASMLELGAGHGQAVHTVFMRLHGKAVACIASNPNHLGGALDAAACQKLARFLRMVQQRGLPLLSLIDTPGFMVGPQAEGQGTVRASGELFWAAAALTVPTAAVVLRRGFGLGAMAMAAGGFHRPQYTAAWPSAEFGAMGLEGAVKLGYKKELEAAPSPETKAELFNQLLNHQIQEGSALRMAETLEIDAVIDPADTRRVVASVFGFVN